MKNKNLSGNLFSKTVLRQSEAGLSNAVNEYLDRKNIFHLRLNSGAIQVISPNGKPYWLKLCKKGTPDRFFIYKGYHIFLELKKQNEKPTLDQLAVHDEIRNSGGFVKVVYTLDDVIAIVQWIEQVAGPSWQVTG